MPATKRELRAKEPPNEAAAWLGAVAVRVEDIVGLGWSNLGDYEGPVWILSGDVPLLSASTLRALAEDASQDGVALSMLSFKPDDPFGYGRVLRDTEGNVVDIREQKDATPEEAAVDEANSGIYCVPAHRLRKHIPNLGTNNAQGEMYLTDLVAMVQDEGSVKARVVDHLEVAGVNTPEQLAELEAAYQARRAGD